MTPEDLRYPVGRFEPVLPVTSDVRAAAIAEIARLPGAMRDAVSGLSDAQLDTPYRPGGWTVRQVVHHVADSHMNGIIRVKLALTEESPTIKPYDENAWARLADMRLPIRVSLELVDGIHTRWVAVYRAMTADQFARSFLHPEHGKRMTLDYHVQEYAWHSRHHVAHVTALRRREGW
ncbi:MAG TPA: putative metal-dependent hydrolase [Vicinamibacterales bacterium]|nr:putative metal-dependent hydrolase [Vicinamibacterales bacterium]